jgi:uncharacterized protein (TIGR00255 family)
MINSMTGYGSAEGQFNGVTCIVEIRTVNNRYFKTKIKLPDPLMFLEEDIEKLLQTELSRGMVNYVLRLKNISTGVLFDIDETALRAVVKQLGAIASSLNVNSELDIGGLLALPGIVQPALPDEKTARQAKKKILGITRNALKQLKQMRATEGAALSADLNSHCEAIKQDLKRIRVRSRTVLREYQKKLKKRVNELLTDGKIKLDETTLAREVAAFADRSDISEELARLSSHLQQFGQSCRTNKQAGRRLDFISQEMLRETNTIASKTSDMEISRCMVNIKCQIDRIKEQVQNVE